MMNKVVLTVVMLGLGGCVFHPQPYEAGAGSADSTVKQPQQGELNYAQGLIVGMAPQAAALSEMQLKQVVDTPALYGVLLRPVRAMANNAYLLEASGLKGEAQLKVLIDALATLPTVRFVEADKRMRHN